MYRRLILMILGFICTIIVLVFFTYIYLQGNREYIFYIIAISLYLIYVFYLNAKEFKLCYLDRKHGIETAVLKLCDYKIFNGSARDGIPYMSLATFEHRRKNEIISLRGNYDKIHMEIGKRYKVKFYRYTACMIDIEKL